MTPEGSMSVPSTTASAGDAGVHYPESDGKPMGETGFHVNAILSLHAAFLIAFRGRTDIYVASDMFLYYERGNPRAVKAPDVMVIKDTHNQERRTFKLWVENVEPSAIFEITSDETRREDATTKPEVYARIGVPEYFLFDPLGDYLDPPLQAYRLDGAATPRSPPTRPAACRARNWA
jgi:Uma2 family endonuclease